jgi:hypothetical protein
MPADECQIVAFDRSAADRVLEGGMRVFGPGDHEETGRLAVQPVDDARPLRIVAASCSERQELPCERAGARSRARMNGESRRLVHDEEMLVLEQHRDRRGLWLKTSRSGRKLDIDHRAGLESVTLLPHEAVDEHGALLEQPLGD